MALTVSSVAGPYSVGDRWETVSTITFDSSYATGGEALTRVNLGFSNTPDNEFQVLPLLQAGINFVFDYTNQKLLAYVPVAVYSATFDPASLAATTSRDDAIAFTGVAATDECVRVEPPAAILASVVVQGARVTGADTITVRLTNASAGAVDVVSGTWKAYVAGANGRQHEVPNTTDLSALSGIRLVARGKFAG